MVLSGRPCPTMALRILSRPFKKASTYLIRNDTSPRREAQRPTSVPVDDTTSLIADEPLSILKRRLFAHATKKIGIPSTIRTGPEMPTSIFNLPSELLQIITEFLPIPSKAAFALCSRYVRKAIGTQYELKPESSWQRQPTLRGEFLLLLERDLLDYIYCYECDILHGVDEYPSIRGGRDSGCPKYAARVPRYCIRKEAIFVKNWRDGCVFPRQNNVSHIRMAMKCHHLGLDCGVHLKHLTGTVTSSKGSFKEQWITETRIVANCLIVRTQHWLLLPPTIVKDQARCETTSFQRFSQPNLEFLCRHYLSPGNSFLLQIIQHYPLKDKGHYGTCSGLERDRFCPLPTEFQVNSRDLGTKGFAIVTTTWRDFGNCKDPFNRKWQAYLRYRTCDWEMPFAGDDRCSVDCFVEGSIQAQFENQKPFVFHTVPSLADKRQLMKRRPS